MGIDVRVIFRGLLHFVQNTDDDALVRMCVVLPHAPGHVATISPLPGTRILLNGSAVDDIRIANKRVVFRFLPLQKSDSGFEDTVMGGRIIGAVPMERIAGQHADRNPTIVSNIASVGNGVLSQVLVGTGAFSLFASSVPPILELPGTLTGQIAANITMSEKIQLNAAALSEARIVVLPLADTLVPDAIYTIEPPSTGPAMIEVQHICTPSGTIQLQDRDFVFHYRLLRALPQGRPLENMPIPKITRFSDPKGLEKNFFRILDLQARGCNCAGARGLARDYDKLDRFMDVGATTQTDTAQSAQRKGA